MCSNWFVGLVVVGMMVVGCALVRRSAMGQWVGYSTGLVGWEGSGVVRECVAA